jgi:hypothetical protein
MVLLLVLGAHSATARHKQENLVTLRIGKPNPDWQTWVTGKGSRVLGSYDDGGDSWSVYVRYRGCPATRHGAFRVTVYQNRYKWDSLGQGSWVADFSKPAVRFSHTAVDYRQSDKVLYTWPAHPESYWQVHIQVPSYKGCARWTYGSETN